MSRRQALAALLAFVVTGGGTLYSVWQTAAMSPPPAPAPVLWLLATAITTAATLSAYIFTGPSAQRLPSAQRRERQRQRAQTAIEDLLGATIQTITAHPEETAAVVYFPDSAGVLRPRFSYYKRKAIHDLLTFEKWQGCTGHAWATGTQTIADLTQATPEQLALTWKLPPEYIEATKDLRVVVSTPIWTSERPEHLLGVLSFDSTVPAEESGLLSPVALAAAGQLAKSIAQILDLAEVAPNDML